MKQYTDKEILEMYQQLPEDVKKAVFSVESGRIIQAIGKKYNLTPDKIGNLANETGMVMLGVSPAKDFIINIARNVYIDKETARKVASDINAQIFAKIRESLKKIHGAFEEEEEIKPAPSPFLTPKPPPPPVPKPTPIITPISQPSPLPAQTSPIPTPIPPSTPGPVKIGDVIDREKILKEIEREDIKHPSNDPYREQI